MDGDIKKALVSAALSAERISKKDNQINSRAARIGNFATCLRRELTKITSSTRRTPNGLTNPENWEDILVAKTRWCPFDGPLKQAIEVAHRQVYGDGTSASNIAFNLIELRNDIDGMAVILNRMETINKEAEVILTGFRELAHNM